MAKAFELPDLGEGIEAGDVVKVLVSEGDSIALDQPVIELETDNQITRNAYIALLSAIRR